MADTPPQADPPWADTPPLADPPGQTPLPQDGHCSGRYASYWNAFLLPPANKVWGKVICLQACVCPQGGVPDQVHPKYQVHPPGADTPESRHPQDQVHPPGPGTPPRTRYTPQGPGTPPDQVHPPGADIPPGPGTPPPAKSMLGDTVNARAVRILLECNLVDWMHSFWHYSVQTRLQTYDFIRQQRSPWVLHPGTHFPRSVCLSLCVWRSTTVWSISHWQYDYSLRPPTTWHDETPSCTDAPLRCSPEDSPTLVGPV